MDELEKRCPAKRSTSESMSNMQVFTASYGPLTIHTLVEPLLGNATHILEFADELVLVDAQFFVEAAKEYRRYADSLDKPICFLVISHDHPDHYFGLAAAFTDVPVRALACTIKEMKEDGAKVLAAEKKIFPDLSGPQAIPDQLLYPVSVLRPGGYNFNGLAVYFKEITGGEDELQLLIDIPQLGVIIVQDLAYHGYHPYLFGSVKDPKKWSPWPWIKILYSLIQLGRTSVFVGHGAPLVEGGLPPPGATVESRVIGTGNNPCIRASNIFNRNIRYLSTAWVALNHVKTAEEYKCWMLDIYPELKGIGLIDLYLPMVKAYLAC